MIQRSWKNEKDGNQAAIRIVNLRFTCRHWRASWLLIRCTNL